LNRKGGSTIFRWFSLVLIFTAVLLTIFQLVTFSRVRSILPAGMQVASVPVGGLDQKQAAGRLTQAYGVPVELRYGDAIIQVKPALVGLNLDLEGMLAAADLQRLNRAFWPAFWDYLWNRPSSANEVPLSATISESRLRAYLKDEIAARYDQLPLAAMPVPGTITFQAGRPGTMLDAERAVTLIEDALRSPSARVVNLTFNQVSPPRPAFQNLQILLKQIIDLSHFDGLIEMYVEDLQTHQELHFALKGGADVQPDIAFSGASTIKIPIMISIFRRVNEPAPKEVTDLIELMIEQSNDDAADNLMKTLDKDTGPLIVTADMQALGLNNTFTTGYFYPGAPLLKKITTPANQRTDITADPDLYIQTTPLEMGMLLDDLYQCAQTGGGSLAAAFPGEITQNECRQMILYLTRNRNAMLLEAGLPEGAQIAHKHGWIISTNDGLMHNMSDAGIVYSSGGYYVITIYMYHPVQLLFDPANQLVAQLSAAVYNYFNMINK
jgi:beta-lactamase class A